MSTVAPDLPRVLPQVLEAEQAILGAVLLDNAALLIARDLVADGDFYATRHQRIWMAMLDLVEGRETIDHLTLAERLQQKGELQTVGGAAYLGELLSITPSAANIRSHCRLVKEAADRRTIIREATLIREAAYDGGGVAELYGRLRHAGNPKVKLDADDNVGDLISIAPKFPLEIFPDKLREFVRQAAASLPVPVDLIAAPVLACLGAAIGAHRTIQPKLNWTARPALYLACIADPGSLKTPALRLVASPIFHQQKTYEEAYQRAMHQYELDLVRYAREIDMYRKGKGEGASIPEKPEKPMLERTWTSDVTTERLAGILQENSRGVLIIRDELSGWIKSFNQYKGGKGADKQFFLSAWSGEPIAVDRQGKEPVIVSHPFLSVVGCIPPDILPDLDEDKREDGFLHRVLFVYPDPVRVRWTDTVVTDVARRFYVDLLRELYALCPFPDGRQGILHLSPPAQRLFIEWHDKHSAEQEDPMLSPFMKGLYAKLKGYAPRFALIHALATNPQAQQIEPESIGAAAELVEYFKLQGQRVAPLLSGYAGTTEGRCEASIQRALASGRAVTKRQIQRAGNAPAAVFNKVWEGMLGRGTLLPKGNPGKSQTFQLRRASLAMDA